MKKVLAVVLSLALLCGSLCAGIVLADAPEPEVYTSKFFVDYSTPEGYAAANAWVSGSGKRVATNMGAAGMAPNAFGNAAVTTSKIAFDSDVNALKLTGNGTSVVDLDIRMLDARTAMPVENYGTLALKVKLPDTTAVLQSVELVAHGPNGSAAASGCNTLYSITTVPTYQATTDWQLVLIDISEDNWSQALKDLKAANTGMVWWGVHMHLAQEGYSAPIYVEWVGIFDSEDSAKKQYDLPVFTSKFFVDYSTQEGYAAANAWVSGSGKRVATNMGAAGMAPNAFGNAAVTTSKIAFDSGVNALKLTGNGTSVVDLDIRMLDVRTAMPVENYGTLALKVKLPDTTAVLQSVELVAHGPNGSAAASGCNTLYSITTVPTYQATTDWQLVLIDISEDNWSQALKDLKAANTGMVWWGVHMHLAQEGYSAPIYVEWVGIFDSDQSAVNHNFYGSVERKEENEKDDEEEEKPEQEQESVGSTQFNTKFYFDFSTQASYDDMLDGRYPATDGTNPRTLVNASSGSGTLSYDATVGALKIVGDGTKSPTLNLRCHDFRQHLTMEKYTTLALKVKVTDSKVSLQTANMFCNDGSLTGTRGPDLRRPVKSPSTYVDGEGWQLLLVDISKNNYGDELTALAEANEAQNLTSTWWGTELVLAEAGYTAPIYIQWVGVFKNDGKALAQYALTTPDVKTNFLFEFDEQEKYADMVDGRNPSNDTTDPRTLVNASSGSGTISYDSENKALKIVGDGTKAPTLNLRCLDWRKNLTLEKHTVLALKVKLGSDALQFQSATMFANDGTITDGAADLKRTLKSLPRYQETTDWQLLVIDLRDDNYGDELKALATANAEANVSSTWWGTEVVLAADGTTTPIYVQWAGIFENESDAAAYYINTTASAPLDTLTLTVGRAPRPTPGKFFYDFSSQNVYTANEENSRVVIGVGADTVMRYDEEEEAMKLTNTSVSATPYLELQCHDRTVNINTGHVLAVKMKITTKEAYFRSAAMYAKDDASVDSSFGGNNSIEDTKRAKELRNYPNYANTTGWQLVLIDLSDENRFDNLANKTGAWYGTRLNLGAAGYLNPFYIAWVGIFNDTESAQAYFDYTTPTNPGGSFEEEFNPDAVEAPTPLFYDFSVKSTTTTHVGTVGDTAIDFDVALRAMKVSAVDKNDDGTVMTTPGSIAFGNRTTLADVTMEEYPLFAMRVKLGSRELMGGTMLVTSEASRENVANGMIDSAAFDVATLDYANTTNWQTIVIDYRDNLTASFFSGGKWISIEIAMLDAYQSFANDTVWIKWAGAFKNMDDVNAYVARASVYETGNDDFGDVDDPSTDDSDVEDMPTDDVENPPADDNLDDIEPPPTGERTRLSIPFALCVSAIIAGAVLTMNKKRIASTKN